MRRQYFLHVMRIAFVCVLLLWLIICVCFEARFPMATVPSLWYLLDFVGVLEGCPLMSWKQWNY